MIVASTPGYFLARKLTKLTRRSKASWGYPNEWLKLWKGDLTITKKMMNDFYFYHYVLDGKIAGFYSLNRVNSRTSILEFLFVDPDYFGKGIGAQLIEHAINYCKKNECACLNVLSDPHAESFYTKYGFKVQYYIKSKVIPDRKLPEMELYFPEFD